VPGNADFVPVWEEQQCRFRWCGCDLGSPAFQINMAAQLGQIFAAERKDNLDFSGIAVIDPQLTLLPQIEANGMMHTWTSPHAASQRRPQQRRSCQLEIHLCRYRQEEARHLTRPRPTSFAWLARLSSYAARNAP
jgi:hypothetical protein